MVGCRFGRLSLTRPNERPFGQLSILPACSGGRSLTPASLMGKLVPPRTASSLAVLEFLPTRPK